MNTSGWNYDRCLQWLELDYAKPASCKRADDHGDVLARLQMECETLDADLRSAEDEVRRLDRAYRAPLHFLMDFKHQVEAVDGLTILNVLEEFYTNGETSARNALSLGALDFSRRRPTSHV